MENKVVETTMQDSKTQDTAKKSIRKIETRRWDKAIAPNHNHHTVETLGWEKAQA